MPLLTPESSATCCGNWSACVSNPPAEQKKIWRCTPRTLCAAITCATCCNCCPRPVAGNFVCNGAIFFSASDRTCANFTACPVTAFAACTIDKPLSKVSNCCVAVYRAWDAAVVSNPSRPGGCPGSIEKGLVVRPVQKTGLPEIERIGGNCAAALNVWTLSATLPAQPDTGVPASCALCHWSCWSECENRFCGKFWDARYVACVVGCTSVPTFATIASDFWLLK